MTAYDISQKKYWNEYQKQYYKENKDQILVIRKEYYEENKERLCEKNNCECGCKYTICHKSTHILDSVSALQKTIIRTIFNFYKSIIYISLYILCVRAKMIIKLK